jgi:hypothetical protein
MKYGYLAAAICLLPGGVPAARAAAYNAVQQFSSSNPSGVWAYGTGITGTSFTPLPTFTSNWYGFGNFDAWVLRGSIPYLGVNESDTIYADGSFIIPPGILIMYPTGKTDTILQWTAPQAGTYSFRGLYEILDRRPSGIAARIFDTATDITTTAFGGKSGVLTGPGADIKNGTPGGHEKFSFQLTVAQGEVVSFGLNSNGSAYFDTTGVAVTVRSTAH